MFKPSLAKFHGLLITPALLPLLFFISTRSWDNHPPVAVTDSYTIHGCAIPLTPDVTANDSDPDGDPFFIDAFPQLPANGTVSRGSGNSVSYCSAYGYIGSDSFTYEICDDHSACTTGNVSLNIVNQPPVGGADSYNVQGTTTIGPFLANDSDPDGDTVTVGDGSHEGIVSFPQHGTLSPSNAGPDRKLYTPNPGYTGSDSFSYNACDGLGGCTVTEVSLSVSHTPPVATPDAYPIRGATIIGPFMANDYDPDGDSITMGGPSQESIVTLPQHGHLIGIVQPDKKSYAPDLGFVGTDSFVYAICDDLQVCSTATVTLYVVGGGENDGLCNPCNGSVGEPINVTNGNMYLQQSDYSLPAVGPAINVARTFNSNSQSTGVFGRGWSTAYDESITVHEGNLMRFNQGDGRAIYFGRQVGSSGVFAPLVGDFHGSLLQNGGNGFTLMMKDGSAHQFNSAGKLTSMSDRIGNQTTIAYDIGGKLISIIDPFGRVLSATTNNNGQVLSLSDSMGTIASYTYGAGNELLSVTYADNSGFSFGYDGNYRLTSATDALGNVVESHTYDAQGRALTSERQGGVEHYLLSYSSDTETNVTDALSHVTKYTFDTSKGRNVVTRVEGLCSCGGGGGSRVQTWTYDNELNVTSKTDALNHATSYTYDGSGNRLTETDAVGTATYTYNGFAEVLTRTDQMNGVTTNTYDAQGNLLSATDARGKTTNFINDSRGLLLTITDARGKVTSLAYDASGNLVTKTDALNHQTKFAYDARSRLTSTTNALGNVTTFAYDAVGRLRQVTQADGTTISYEYDLAGRRIAMTDAKGNRSTYAYDGANRLTSEIDALNQSTSYSYDSVSNLTTSTDALGRTTNFDYDDFNRLAKVTYPPAATSAARLFETIEYDADGNVTKRIDTAGRATQYQYDGVNRLLSVTDPALQLTQYEYNARSEMTALVDALSQRYRFNYNSVGAVTHVRRGTTVTTFTYDSVGNRKTRTDYNGALTDYTYDALNRLKTISYPDTTTVSYTYDKLSRLQTATNENGTVDFDYNKMNRLTRATDVFGQIVEYNYDDNGNRTRLSLNSSVLATYRYDALNRPTKILDAASAAFTFAYDAADRLTQKKAPNNMKTSYQYDDLDRLTRLTDTKGAATVRDRQYQYNAASQITQIAEPSITRNYGYDPTDRLTAASYTNPLQPNENYAYDAVGNRTSSQLSASYGYQPFNRLTNTSTASYSYDSNGNLISRTDAGGTIQYIWDFENRLKQVTLPNGTTITYTYDALGRRIQRARIGGISTNFIYDGQDVVKDSNSDGSTVDYLNGPGVDNKLRLTDSRLAATGPLYFLQDHLGSTTALTNSQGVAVSQINYDSFGNPSAGANLTRYTYTGREFDSDTGLYYYRARWYDPKVGRFISEDPIGLVGGINQFAYVKSGPIGSRDPEGLWPSQGPWKVHQEIIRRVLTGIASPEQLQILMQEQADFDWHSQDEIYANKHAMSRRGERPEDARRKANRFVRGNICMARRLAASGHMSDAMHLLGQAIHTLQDSASPAHAGFAEAWESTLLQDINHLPHNWTENFYPREGSITYIQTKLAWKYFTGESPMPTDFFMNAFDTENGSVYFRANPAPDGGSCDCT